jgi:hypothetical protein
MNPAPPQPRILTGEVVPKLLGQGLRKGLEERQVRLAIQELVASVDPTCRLDADAEDVRPQFP